MARKIIAGTYKFVDAPEKLSQFTSATNILFDDSNGTVINYTTAPLSGITTNKFVLAVDRPNEAQEYLIYAFEDTTAAGGALSVSKGWYWFNPSSTSLDAISTPSVVFSDNCSINDELTTTQGNALFTTSPIQVQPTVTTTRVLYKGKKELTMAQFEALTSLDDAVDYDITDFPNGGITNAQMTAALGYSRLFGDGEIYVCSDNGTYTKGNWYQIKVEGGVKSWEDITKGLKIYTITENLNHDGTKSGIFTEEQINNIKLADILQVYAIDGDPVSKYAYKGLYPTNPAQSTIGANLYFAAATEKGNYVLAINTDTRNWEVREPASGGSQDYQIVTAEPEDKSQGKMIYEKSSGVTLGKAVVDKTPAGKYYSSPAGLVDKIFGGTAVPSDIETYEYLLFKENEYVAGYINIGNLPELTQYALTHDSIEVIFKVNNGAEQSDILTKNSDGSFGNATNKFQTMKSANLVEGAGSDYYTLDLQAGGVAQSFKIAETDTIQITKLKLGDAYINIDKGGSEGSFAIANLKISDGTNYNSLKDYLGGSPLYKHELEIAYSFLLPDSVEVNGSVMYHYLSNKGTQITSASEIDDNFLLSGAIGKNGSNTAASQSESTALTWTINDTNATPPGSEIRESINFSVQTDYVVEGTSFIGIVISPTSLSYILPGDNVFDYALFSGNSLVWKDKNEVDTSAYRTITFETAPTGELLTWLQANAVPQGGASSTTVLLLNITVIKAGSSITVEAVNASTMGYITGTVGTITDTATQLI